MSFASLIIASGVAAAILLLIVALNLRIKLRRKALRLGYPSVGEYLRAAPRSDEEKRDAVSFALTGMVLCMLGLIFPPFLLIGLLPLFYGARKVACAAQLTILPKWDVATFLFSKKVN